MKILHAFNYHKGGGGSDNAWDASIRILKKYQVDVHEFSRDSRDLPDGITGKVRALVNGIYSRSAVQSFRKELSAYQPDVVHVHELYPLISPWILPECSKAGVPVVATLYDFRLTCPIATHFNGSGLCHKCHTCHEGWAIFQNCRGRYPESVAYALRSLVTRKFQLFTAHTDRFIVLSKFSKDWLTDKLVIPAQKITINPCIIPLPEASADPAGGKYIAYAGRIVPEKGINILVKAAKKAGLPLKVAVSHKFYRSNSCRHDIDLVKTKNASDLAAFYRNARFLVMPSIWYETFGIVAAEAMSHGIPVIASRMGALQDIVVDGKSGLLFEPGDTDDLLSKISQLWHDSALNQRMGAAAREQVKNLYSDEVHYQNLIRVYNKAINRPGLIL